jgi:hypothetical protein
VTTPTRAVRPGAPRSRRRAAARRPDRHRDRGGELALEQGEKAYSSHAGDTGFERTRRVDERREQRAVALDDDAPRRRAAHDPITAGNARSRDCRCRPAGAESASRSQTPSLAVTAMRAGVAQSYRGAVRRRLCTLQNAAFRIDGDPRASNDY